MSLYHTPIALEFQEDTKTPGTVLVYPSPASSRYLPSSLLISSYSYSGSIICEMAALDIADTASVFDLIPVVALL